MTLDRFERFSFALAEISKYWHKLAAEEMAKYGLRGPHATYLTAISRHPEGITVPDLCEATGKDKSDASRMIGILEEKGLVEKRAVDKSRYRGLLFLTETGAEAARGVAKKASSAVEAAGRDLTEEERESLYRSLASIVENLRKLSETGIPE